MSRARSSNQIATWLITGCAGVIVLALVCASAFASRQHRAQEELRHARPDAARFAVILDATDPLSAAQVLSLQARLRRLEDEQLRSGDQLSLWMLGSTTEGALQRDLVLICPPRRANPFYENPRMVAAQYDSLFATPVARAVAPLAGVSPTRGSPIVEAVGAVAESPELRSGPGPRCLVLVSDLQQNTSRLSFCAEPTDTSLWRTGLLHGPYPNLKGVLVVVIFVPRPQINLETELTLRHLWQSYFEAAGAASVEFDRL